MQFYSRRVAVASSQRKVPWRYLLQRALTPAAATRLRDRKTPIDCSRRTAPAATAAHSGTVQCQPSLVLGLCLALFSGNGTSRRHLRQCFELHLCPLLLVCGNLQSPGGNLGVASLSP